MQSGAHAIAVSELADDQTVDYALTLLCIAGICPAIDPSDVAGRVAFRGGPLTNRRIRLIQPDEEDQETRTDVRGCSEFEALVPGGRFKVRIAGPEVPE